MALHILYIRDRLDQAKSEQAKQNKKQYARRYNNNKSILYLNVSSALGDGSGAHDVPMSMYIIYCICNMLCRYIRFIFMYT